GGSSPPRTRKPAARRSWKVRRGTPQTALAFSPDGESVVTVDQTGTIRVRHVVGGRTRQTLPLKVPCVALGVSAQLVALGEEGTLVHVPRQQGRPAVAVWEPPRRLSLTALAVSANGTYVAVGGASGVVRCWSVAQRKLVGANRQRGRVSAVA